MTDHRRNLSRYEGRGDARFLTCSCYHRLPLFTNDAIKHYFVEYLAKAKQRLGFSLYAWVVMPEHTHLLLRPKDHTQTAAQILRAIKAGFAKIVLDRWQALKAPILTRLLKPGGGYAFWQPGGGHDRNIYTSSEYEEKLAYTHHNPVKRGLVADPMDWPWSSLAWYYDRARYNGPDLDVLM